MSEFENSEEMKMHFSCPEFLFDAIKGTMKCYTHKLKYTIDRENKIWRITLL